VTGAAGGRGEDRVGGQAGFTLIELLVTIAIMGIAFVAILAGMETAIIGSSVHRDHAATDAVLRSLADTVRHAPYVPCPAPSDYAAGFTPPTSFTVTPPTVQYLDAASGLYVPACPSSGGDRGLQLVKLEVHAPPQPAPSGASSGRTTVQSVSVVKRDPCPCP